MLEYVQRKKNTEKDETELESAPQAESALPSQLKTGLETLSGYAMDDVRVHRNSSKPAGVNAHAFAEGRDIHLAPGQEKHLPHEAWHVVQQKQGRVQPTMQMKGKVNVNDDVGLEREADLMGAKAAALGSDQAPVVQRVAQVASGTIQRAEDEDDSYLGQAKKLLEQGAGVVSAGITGNNIRKVLSGAYSLYHAETWAQTTDALTQLMTGLQALTTNSEYAILAKELITLINAFFKAYNEEDDATWRAEVAKIMVKLGTLFAMMIGVPPSWARGGRTALEFAIDHQERIIAWSPEWIRNYLNGEGGDGD